MAKNKFLPRKTGGNLYQWKPMPYNPKRKNSAVGNIVITNPPEPDGCTVTYVAEDYTICDYVV